jgi:hypothetical protein
VGQGQRAPEGVGLASGAPAPATPPAAGDAGGAIEYRLGDVAATRRARATALLGAASSLAPVVLAVVLMRRLGLGLSGAFWAVAAALSVLVLVRAMVSFGAMRRSLRSLAVVVSDDGVRVATARDARAIPRARVARIIEVEGALGGLRVESSTDPAGELGAAVYIPRGGADFGRIRARLEGWRAIERRGRRGPGARFAMGTAIVLAFFFAPFVLEDVVARSKVFAAALVVGMWAAMRVALRPR